jgi:hypothetical protein
MTWIYLLLLGIVGFALSEGENPLAQPGVWILGAIIAVHRLALSRRRRGKSASRSAAPSGSPAIAPGQTTTPAGAELDMFHGLRGWSEAECAPEVATATCSLSGRDAAYLRSLLVMSSLRGDDVGRVVAAAARRLLRPAA